MTPAQKKILVVAIIVVFAVLLIGLWNSFYARKVLSPKPAEEGESRISQKELQLSPEVLKALTPPKDAKPLELSPEVLKALMPPKDAKPLELSPDVLKSLTPR